MRKAQFMPGIPGTSHLCEHDISPFEHLLFIPHGGNMNSPGKTRAMKHGETNESSEREDKNERTPVFSDAGFSLFLKLFFIRRRNESASIA